MKLLITLILILIIILRFTNYNNLNLNKVYVLNLERRKDRMEFMDKQLKKFGIKYTRFNACDGKTLDKYKSDYDIYIHPRGKINKHKGQIGCSLSHIKILEDIVKNKYTHAMILEDDAEIINTNFKDNVNNLIKELPKDYNFVLLGGSILRGNLIKNKSYIIKGSKFPKTNWFLTGYIINYKFAKLILNTLKLEKTPFTIDEFLMRRFYPYVNYFLSVIPQLKQNRKFETDIIKSPVYSNVTIEF